MTDVQRVKILCGFILENCLASEVYGKGHPVIFDPQESHGDEFRRAWLVEMRIRELHLCDQYVGALKEIVSDRAPINGWFKLITANPTDRFRAAILAVRRK